MLSIEIMKKFLLEYTLKDNIHYIQIDYLDYLNIGVVIMKGPLLNLKQYVFASNGEIVLFEEGYECMIYGNWRCYEGLKTNESEPLVNEKLEPTKDCVI